MRVLIQPARECHGLDRVRQVGSLLNQRREHPHEWTAGEADQLSARWVDLGSCLPRPPVRSGRAQLGHPAPQITGSLRNARSSARGWPAAAGEPA